MQNAVLSVSNRDGYKIAISYPFKIQKNAFFILEKSRVNLIFKLKIDWKESRWLTRNYGFFGFSHGL